MKTGNSGSALHVDPGRPGARSSSVPGQIEPCYQFSVQLGITSSAVPKNAYGQKVAKFAGGCLDKKVAYGHEIVKIEKPLGVA